MSYIVASSSTLYALLLADAFVPYRLQPELRGDVKSHIAHSTGVECRARRTHQVVEEKQKEKQEAEERGRQDEKEEEEEQEDDKEHVVRATSSIDEYGEPVSSPKGGGRPHKISQIARRSRLSHITPPTAHCPPGDVAAHPTPSAVGRGARLSVGDTIRDRLSEHELQLFLLFQLFIAFVTSMNSAVHLAAAHEVGENIFTLHMIGLGVAMLGAALRAWSRLTLGRLFTYQIGIRSGHRLITTGPYKYLLHPSYTGLILIQIGFGVFHASLVYIALAMCASAMLLSTRIPDEERMLQEEFGEEFSARLRSTNRLIPFVW